MKFCAGCQQDKENDQFPKNKRNKDGLHCYCRSCHSARQRKRYTEKREELLEYHKEYYRNNKEKKKEYDKKYYLRDKERKHQHNKNWNDKNRKRINEWIAEWKRQNPHKVTEYTGKRRAATLLAVPDWLTEEQLEEISYIYWTAKDLQAITGEKYHVDHIVPLQGKNVCGLHVPWNLQVLPAKDNLKKGNKLEQY